MQTNQAGCEARPVYTLRLGNTERRILEQAAEHREEALAAFIRRTALMAAVKELGMSAGALR